MVALHNALCFRDVDDLEEGKILTIFLNEFPSFQENDSFSRLEYIFAYIVTEECLFLFFFSAGLLKLNFNDTLVSSTHTFPVNIFNLEGGETMLARDKGNFYAQGKNRTRDPPVQWLECSINM